MSADSKEQDNLIAEKLVKQNKRSIVSKSVNIYEHVNHSVKRRITITKLFGITIYKQDFVYFTPS